VLLHGTPSSSFIFRGILPVLTAAGFKAHVFDLLGYGLSERPWDMDVDTSISGQVAILSGLLRAWELESERVHIISHDIGGGVAQRFGVFNPGRVRSMTLIDVVSFDSYPSERTRHQMASGPGAVITNKDEVHRDMFREWLVSAVKNELRFKETALGPFLSYISGPVGQASFFQHQARHYDSKHTMEIAGRVHELGQSPVQIIWGAEDSWQIVDWARRLHQTIAGSTLEIIPDCGHFSPEDQPERISELLVSFMQQHERH